MNDAATKIYTVSEITYSIKSLLETTFSQLCIRGEITNLTQQASGHLYFSLKDDQAQISCVLFRNVASSLSKLPKVGDKVILKGSLSLYAPRGNYQLVVSHLQHEGVGDLLLKLHELKEKLQKKGYFDQAHKKPLPKYPKTIAVITSPTGAVIHDILHVLERRLKGFHLILNPVKVQGEGAEKEIAQAIYDLNRYQLADVIILGRGGGSLEDLWAFNEECVVEAIYHSKIPIIASIGHETDVSLADFAADVRAPTPSAAAEIVMKEQSIHLDFLDRCQKNLLTFVSHLLQRHRLKLDSLSKQKILNSAEYLLAPFFQSLDSITEDLDEKMKSQLQTSQIRLLGHSKTLNSLDPAKKLSYYAEKNNFYKERLDQLISQRVQREKERVSHLKLLLTSLNPKEVLKKGYCIPFAEKSHSVIISSMQPKQGDSLLLLFHDGEIKTTVSKDVHG